MREPIKIYDDYPCSHYSKPNGIYKKITTYGEVLAERNELNLSIARGYELIHSMFERFNYFEIMLKKDISGYFKENFGIA